ncbi:MAG TPA: alginate lyase family protein [Vicinamibacterales bacterium]|nr:alginate lyase family protein [Vicinamibacterales bacterium]
MNLARLTCMDAREIAWRGRAAARIAWDRLAAARTRPVWDRRQLLTAISDDPALDVSRGALEHERWREAHRALALHLTFTPQRFVLAPSNHATLAPTLRARFPGAAADATARADRILAGSYDLLGYRNLAFRAGGDVNWHQDPVHNCDAPLVFWSDVPYLDPTCGDHKIIWELNRHQHWLALGRAFWMTSEVRYRERCVAELQSWMAANPPLTGINWASMLELGFRSLSWLWALAFFADSSTSDEPAWIVDLLLALDRQLSHIERNLSFYFSPNTHLLGEALALYVCSRALPLLRASAAREALGRRILLDESRRQVSPDGGHCERSTHYHRYTLDFYLLASIVARITNDSAAPEFERTAARLADAARLLADDNGELPLIGDDDGGMLLPIAGRAPNDIRDSLAVAAALLDRPYLRIGPPPEESYWLLAHPSLAQSADDTSWRTHARVRSAALRDTGYYVSRSNRGDHLVIDGGVHGHLNGGHAHADALSLTLAVSGVPLLVDPGTGAYTIDQALRDRLRSSQLHNTVVVDGRSQSIGNGPFSWKTTARSRVHKWQTHQAFDYFEGTHDGYWPIEHRRHVLTLPGDLMVVGDFVAGEGTHTASVHWHIDPRWRVHVTGRSVTFATKDAQCQLVAPRGRVERFDGDTNTGLGWRAPVYGNVERATSLRITHCGALPLWMASVFGLTRANAVIDVEFLPVTAENAAVAVALRVVRAASLDYVFFAARPSTIRCGAFVTDARVFVCRERDGRIGDVMLIDGSHARVEGEHGLAFDAPYRMPHVYLTGT